MGTIFSKALEKIVFGLIKVDKLNMMLKFLCDQMLIELGRWLRTAGYDVLIAAEDQEDIQILKTARDEKRILLTCDRHFLEMKSNENVIFLQSNYLENCVKELNAKLSINWLLKPFSRCLKCNQALDKIDKEKILGQIPKLVRENCDDFKICSKCKKIYWEGSHTEDMLKTLKEWSGL